MNRHDGSFDEYGIPGAIFAVALIGVVVVMLHADDAAWMARFRLNVIAGVLLVCVLGGVWVYWRRSGKRAEATVDPAVTATAAPSVAGRLDTVVIALAVRGGGGQRLLERLPEWRALGGQELVSRVVKSLDDQRHAWIAVACLDDDPVSPELAPGRVDVPLDRLDGALPEGTRASGAGYRETGDHQLTVVALGGATESGIENVGGSLDADRLSRFLQSLAQVGSWHQTRLVVGGPLEQDALDALPMRFRQL